MSVAITSLALLESNLFEKYDKKNIMHNNLYLYTLPNYRETILAELATLSNSNKPGAFGSLSSLSSNDKDLVVLLDEYLHEKVSRAYLPVIVPHLERFASTGMIVQKSQEWLDARKNLIAASEAGYLLGVRSCSSMITYIKNKCNLASSTDKLNYLSSIRHGNIYEDVTRAIYQSRHGVIVQEYGLITTPKNKILGASPDGLVTNYLPDKKCLDSVSRIGRLVEIKNPYDYDPSDLIKPEYAIQILQQQFVLDIPVCDFVKTNIIGGEVNSKTAEKGYTPYKNIDDFLADIPLDSTTIIHNPHIPLNNLTKHGLEKGVIIHYKNTSTGEYIVQLYPLDKVYTKTDIQSWISSTKTDITTKTGIAKSLIAVEYWYLASYYETTLEYNYRLFEKVYLPRLELMWDVILHIRNLQLEHPLDRIMDFINNTLKEHVNKPSAYYKSLANQNDICKILKGVMQLEIGKPIDNDVSAKSVTKDLTEKVKEEKKKASSKPSKPSKPKTEYSKIIIEYDF